MAGSMEQSAEKKVVRGQIDGEISAVEEGSEFSATSV
jgi:hypothetical protein